MSDDRRGTGYVYLLEGGGTREGWYRIGRTTDPQRRFTQWQWMARNGGYELFPLYIVRVERQGSAERMFHRIFRDKRTNERKRGMGPRREWFALQIEDLWEFEWWADIIGEETFYLDRDWENVSVIESLGEQ